MPIHDWKRADVGLYHHFHQQWAGELCDGLNAGVLPSGYYALIDMYTVNRIPDVLALQSEPAAGPDAADSGGGGVALASAPPKTWYVAREADEEAYARRANRLAVRNRESELVAIVEIVSPGNKHSRAAVRKFLDKTTDFLLGGVHVLIVDPFPPTPRDPNGLHPLIWGEFQDEPFALPRDKPLTLASYLARPRTAYVDAIAVGDPLPAMPLFLNEATYVKAPLEETYARTWQKCPRQFREQVENPPA